MENAFGSFHKEEDPKKEEDVPMKVVMEEDEEPEEKIPLSLAERLKNYQALTILLVGLVVGSAFVDVAQLVSGSGFSAKAVNSHDLLVAGGKTWVAYTDPRVTLQVLTDDTCTKCDPSEALVWLRRISPTIEAVNIDAKSDAGKKMITDYGVTTLPAFVFGKDVDKTSFYTQAAELFTAKNGNYVFDVNRLGLPVGKYLSLPEINDKDITIGSADAKVKVVEFSDFQCPYCRAFQTELTKAMSAKQNDIQFVYKNLPLDIHPQAMNAALAGECANEQGKFSVYSDMLFTQQSDWGNTTGTQKFKDYARKLGMNATQFNSCIDTQKYANKIAADKAEAAQFMINGTPGTFIGDTFFGGVVTADEVSKAIDDQLAK